MSGKRVIGWRIKDTKDDELPYALRDETVLGWRWMSRAEARGRTMQYDVAIATLSAMRAWAKSPDGSVGRAWDPRDLRLVRVVKGGAR